MVPTVRQLISETRKDNLRPILSAILDTIRAPSIPPGTWNTVSSISLP